MRLFVERVFLNFSFALFRNTLKEEMLFFVKNQLICYCIMRHIYKLKMKTPALFCKFFIYGNIKKKTFIRQV